MINNKMSRIYIYLALPLVAIMAIILLFAFGGRDIELKKNSGGEKPKQVLNENLSPISGLPCKDYKRRPFAVMLAEDEAARPLSGLASADLVIEMPVMTDGMNRMMAVYVCGNPDEIGSIRSARHDFIPLAMGFDAIFAHWGGSHFSLDKLRSGLMDNIDALIYSRSTFWRQTNIAAPHNGFTNIEKLYDKAEDLDYRLNNEFAGYKHRQPSTDEEKSPARLTIGYPGVHAVYWDYDPFTNAYSRWRNDQEEKDFNNKKQVSAKNIIVMRAESHHLESQYNDVDIEGGGDAEYYLDGEVLTGTWSKEGKDKSTKLFFYGEDGKEVEFVPGQIWIEVIEPGKKIIYEIN